jgi:uncharacterized protein (DUF1697 family)
MTALASLYKDLGFNDPETFIQSGNVIFSAAKPLNPEEAAGAVESAIRKKFGYEVPVMVRTVSEMKDLIACNPYLSLENFDPAKMAVIFLKDMPADDQLSKVAGVDYPPDMFRITGKQIYTFCPNGFGRTKIYTNFFEKKMKVTGTARNWNTVTTMLELAGKRK